MMAALEFVVFDANGKEVDWVDPVIDYRKTDENCWTVDNGYAEYRVYIPEGGYHEVRILA